ncbi:putative T7SS-secreted protein [Cryobacterium sp. W22_MBD10_FK3]|uniref:putative T7SS-secreted protein n=1 Tax=Cryobacterium sp. W22_MBD10_FK3 TaxID=3240273 RepID=UPI003F9247C5
MTDSEFRALEGDPDLLRTKAQHYAEIANAISRSVNTLNTIKSVEGMTSKAIDAIREEAGKVADDISKAKDRYSGTASALITYSAQLRIAQDSAKTAIAHIGDKETASETAGRTATRTAATAESATPENSATDTAAAEKAEEAAQAAGQALQAAQAEWHSALDVKNQAAETAITAILEVVEGKKSQDLNDTWWDDWGAKALDILKVICDWAGVLAIFLAWVPILGQVLLVLAAVGAVLTLIEATVKAINGDGSWWAVAGAAVGAVLSVFGGKIFAIGAKTLRASMITKAATRLDGAPALTRQLSGVGRHSSTYMSIDDAAAAVAKPFKESLGEAFKKSFRPEFTEGAKPLQLLREAAEKALPTLDNFTPSSLLKLNTDLVDFYRMAGSARHLLDTPMVVQGVILSTYQVHTSYNAVTNLMENPSAPFLGDYADVVDLGQKTFGRD